MKVISGKYKGKQLKGFDIVGTRPTMDRIKESLFAIIQNKIKDSICLDLFAGSGSLGLEALSNGAKKCIFVDKNKLVIKVLKENLKGIENTEIIESDFKKYLNRETNKFDIIFLDPPYKMHIINEIIELILKNNLINDNGLIICEYEDEKIITSLELIKERKYGSKIIKIYKK